MTAEELQELAFANATPEQVADELMKQKDVLINAYEQAGMQNVKLEKKTVTFLGEERVAILTTATVSDIPCCSLQIQDYSAGAYGVTLTGYLEDKSDACCPCLPRPKPTP